jgi:predicted metal-dependent hydrolase
LEVRSDPVLVSEKIGACHLFILVLVKPGVLRRAFIPYFRFLKKDFHPWEDDDRYLIDEWEAKHQAQ